MTTAIRAIPTHYNGWHFRSRTEARWAVFMDTLGVEYVYEPEAFELATIEETRAGPASTETVRYLPDFWLPGLDSYLEIKPTYAEAEEALIFKVSRLALATGKRCYVQWGVPTIHDPSDGTSFDDVPEWMPSGAMRYPGPYGAYLWCEALCGCIGIERGGVTGGIECVHAEENEERWLQRCKGLVDMVPMIRGIVRRDHTDALREAVRRARAERFGH